MRRLVLLAACVSLPLLAACTSILGDFSTGGAGSDAATDTNQKSDGKGPPGDGGLDGGSDGPVGMLKAVATGETVYVGQTATVDGSKSSSVAGTPTFSWSFVSVPPTSAIKDGSLVGGGTAKPTFDPDVAGDYKLKLTIQRGAHQATADATVTAVAPEVFYFQTSTNADGGITNMDPDATSSSAYFAVDYNGKNARPVMCPDLQSNYVGTGEIALFGGLIYDVWEGEAGQPPKYAGFTVGAYTSPEAGGSFASHLWSGTSAASCDGGTHANDLGLFPQSSASGNNVAYGNNPRISPDGSRIAILDPNQNIVTLSFDGSERHTVAAYFEGDVDGAASILFDPIAFGESIQPRIQWLGTSVAWARPNDTGWEIVTAPDTASAAPTVYMSCAGVTPREFEFLADGTVVASYRTAPSAQENLYLLDKTCTALHTYTNLSASVSSVATDFSVSPDGKSLAFLSLDPAVQDAAIFDGGLGGGYLFISPIDNSTPPVQIGTHPALYGPRWIGGGTLLVFTRLEGPLVSNALPTSAVVITPDGGFRLAVATADGVSTVLSTSGSGACNMSGAAAGPGAFSLLSLVAIAHFLRRKRRDS
jgi:hypothetical protein